jgi:Adenine-specific methyltransferase EcoRI
MKIERGLRRFKKINNMPNQNLTQAKKAKNDEFYTQYQDIEKEMNAYLEYNADVFRGKTILLPCDDPEWSNFTKYFAQNFDRFGLKKLISTSYAADSKEPKGDYQPSLFETEDPQFDKVKTVQNGKIFTLTSDRDKNGKIDYSDLEWRYLEGDGDFRSDEIKKLRDEADIIITNPPFSLFREFLMWITQVDKQLVIIGNMNAITYKETFPLIKQNKLWLGVTNFNDGMYFKVNSDFEYASTYKFEREQNGAKVSRVPGVCWFTNIDHGRRHQPLPLMTMADNRKFNTKVQKAPSSYVKYDNYDAIEIPFTNAIPSDYEGVMGVPISFLDKYSPEQFELIGATESEGRGFSEGLWIEESKISQATVADERVYKRIFIKHKNVNK